MRKWTLTVLCFVLVFSALWIPVHASQIDPDRSGSITASMTQDGEPIPGGTLTIYQVAVLDLDSETGFRTTDAYEDYRIPLDQVGPAAALLAATYTYEKNIQGQEMAVNAQGVVSFENLQPGLYLLIQWEAAPGYYHLAPFLVSVPNNENGTYVYDVTCVPKQELIPEITWPTLPDIPTVPSAPPDEPEQTTPPPETTEPEPPETTEPEPPETTEPEPPVTTEPESPETTEPEPTENTEPKPSEPQLPQTGQNHWPVPVLAVGGVFFLVLGVICLRHNEKKYPDA